MAPKTGLRPVHQTILKITLGGRKRSYRGKKGGAAITRWEQKLYERLFGGSTGRQKLDFFSRCRSPGQMLGSSPDAGDGKKEKREFRKESEGQKSGEAENAVRH